MIKDRMGAGMFLGVVFSASLFVAFEAGRCGQLPAAHADNAPMMQGEHTYAAFSGFGSSASGQVEDLILIDSKSNKLGVYRWKNEQLELVAVRSLQYDFRLAEFGKQVPGAEEIKKLLETKK